MVSGHLRIGLWQACGTLLRVYQQGWLLNASPGQARVQPGSDSNILKYTSFQSQAEWPLLASLQSKVDLPARLTIASPREDGK